MKKVLMCVFRNISTKWLTWCQGHAKAECLLAAENTSLQSSRDVEWVAPVSQPSHICRKKLL